MQALRSSVSAKDQDALKFMDKLEVKYNELTEPSVNFPKMAGFPR